MLVLAPQKISAIYEYIASVHLNGGFLSPRLCVPIKAAACREFEKML